MKHVKRYITFVNEQDISSILDKLKNTVDDYTNSFKSYTRKYFPNLIQAIYPRDLYTKDFTKNQLKVLYSVILNAIKRGENPKKGGTQYEDYGGDISKYFIGRSAGSADSFDMILNTLTPNDSFKMATTLGRFSYELMPNNVYRVTDIYDFNNPGDYNKINSSELKNKNYAEKLMYIMTKYKWSLYKSMRYIAWLENPDETTNKKPQINIEINPKNFS